MGVEDEYEGGPDQLAEKMENLDEVLAEQRAEALRAGLEDFDLDEDDAALLAGLASGEGAIEFLPALPVVAIVGRPNVGKSALVNRILGRREAVVEDTPGVTRDRVTYKAEWLDRRFSLVDTGGWEPDAKGIDRSVAAQAEVAIDLADVVLFVVDATVGATSTDEHVVKLLRKSKKPVFLIANIVPRTLVARVLFIEHINRWTMYGQLSPTEGFQYYGFPLLGLLLLAVSVCAVAAGQSTARAPAAPAIAGA